MPQAPLPPQTHSPFYRHKPLLQFLILIVYCLAGAMLFGLLGIGVAMLISKQTSAAAAVNYNSPGGATMLKLIQLFSAFGTFIVPAWLLARSQRQRFGTYFRFNKVTPLMAAAAVVLALAMQPVISNLSDLNSHLALPHFLQGAQQWMQQKEGEMKQVTEIMLSGSSVAALLLNLLVAALLPAIGEELVFRGALQPIFNSLLKNHHAGIWLTAFVFAAVHMQFFSFLPRFALGVIFGYVYHYSQNLWLTTILHFINNAGATVMYYVYNTVLHKPKALEQGYVFNLPATLLATAIGGAALYYLIKQSHLYVQQLGKSTNHAR